MCELLGKRLFKIKVNELSRYRNPEKAWGAFHLTKYSSLKFWVFDETKLMEQYFPGGWTNCARSSGFIRNEIPENDCSIRSATQNF